MSAALENEEVETVRFPVDVDLETVAWLMELAESTMTPPAVLIASIIRDIRIDDQAEHTDAVIRQRPASSPRLN